MGDFPAEPRLMTKIEKREKKEKKRKEKRNKRQNNVRRCRICGKEKRMLKKSVSFTFGLLFCDHLDVLFSKEKKEKKKEKKREKPKSGNLIVDF